MEFKEAENRDVVSFFYDEEGKLTARLEHISDMMLEVCKKTKINPDTLIEDILRVATFLFARELRRSRAAGLNVSLA
jgi:hypothetical protein